MLFSLVLSHKSREAFIGVVLFSVHVRFHCPVEADGDLLFHKAFLDASCTALVAVCRIVGALIVNAGAEMIFLHIVKASLFI